MSVMIERTDVMIHPLRKVRSLMRLWRSTLPRSLGLERELMEDWCAEAEESVQGVGLAAEASLELIREVGEQCERVGMDEFSRAAIFCRLEALTRFQSRIVERCTLGVLAVCLLGVFFWSTGDEDPWRRCGARPVRVVRMVRGGSRYEC